MEMTNFEMINHINFLFAFKKEANGILRYNIARNKANLFEEYKKFDEARTDTKKQYCELDENGNIKMIEIKTEDKVEKKEVFKSPEDEMKWNEEHLKMLNEKVEVRIRQSRISDLENIFLTDEEMDCLMFMIQDEEVE